MWDPAATALRVLVVDDNVDTAENLAWLLQYAGHETRVALFGRAAVDAAGEFRPDVVLLDVGLPDVDGFEVARRIRALPGLTGTFLIAATGYAREQDRRRAADAGFDHYLVKPFDPRDLCRLLAAHRPAAAVPA